MQREMKLANNYVSALLASHDTKDLLKLSEDLEAISEIWQSSRDLRDAVLSPNIPHSDRAAVLESVTSKLGYTDKLKNLIRLLFKNRRLSLLPLMVKELEARVDKKMKRKHATIQSALELDVNSKASLETTVKNRLGTEVALKWEVDPGLIGGFVIQVGYDIYDCSVQAQLDALTQKLTATTVANKA
jgi:ATP synthase F1 delta subunit